MREAKVAGSSPTAAPRLIVPMSLRLAIPWRVALQQSSPPLHQPGVILKQKEQLGKENPSNGKCASSQLSHRGVHPRSLCYHWRAASRRRGELEASAMATARSARTSNDCCTNHLRVLSAAKRCVTKGLTSHGRIQQPLLKRSDSPEYSSHACPRSSFARRVAVAWPEI